MKKPGVKGLKAKQLTSDGMSPPMMPMAKAKAPSKPTSSKQIAKKYGNRPC